jgi:hypothetical protein
MMTEKNRDRLLIKPYEKKGESLHVEQTIQSILDHPDMVGQTLENSNAWLDNHFPDTVSGKYKNTSRRVQIALGAMGHLAAQRAIPKLIENYESSGSISAPEDIPADFFDAYLEPSMHWHQASNAAIESHRISYWLIEACNETQELLEDTKHSLHPLLDYFSSSNKSRYLAWQQWREGPGRNRWPTKRQNPSISLASALNSGLIVNTELCNSLMGSRVIHYMDATGHLDITSENLAVAAAETIDKMHRHTSSNRHLGWEPDWMEEHNSIGYVRKWMPTDGTEALLQCPVGNIVKPNAFAASVEGASMMQDPDFVQHELLRNHPVAASGVCSGNVFYRPSMEHREEARHFFEITGFHPDNGNCFSVAGLALVMSHVALRTILLPAFDENRQKEGTLIVDR